MMISHYNIVVRPSVQTIQQQAALPREKKVEQRFFCFDSPMAQGEEAFGEWLTELLLMFPRLLQRNITEKMYSPYYS